MKKGTKIIKKGTVVVLTIAMIFGLTLGISKPQVVHAEGNSKNMNLGTKGISDPIGEEYQYPWYGSYVYFGSYNGTMVKYRVLDAQTTDFSGDGTTKTMLLDCNTILWNGDTPSSKFDDSSNVWANSYIKKYLNSEGSYSNTGFLTTSFTAKEQVAIAESTKATSLGLAETLGNLNYAGLSGEKIFLLDATEVENAKYGYSHMDSHARNRMKFGCSRYWLRSAGSNSSNVGYVDVSSYLQGKMDVASVNDSTIGVSPALNLKLSSVLFTSAAEGSKSSTTITDFSSLPGVSDYSGVKDAYYGNREEWKFTLLDNSVDVPNITNVARNGDTLSFDYAGVTTGINQKLSAIITSGTGASETIVSYGVLKDAADNSEGSVSITLPSDWDSKGYTLKVFSEQNNGDKKTDYAGAFAALTVPAKIVEIPTVAINEITTPLAGTALDLSSACGTTGVSETTSAVSYKVGAESVTGDAKFNTVYTASVTLSAVEGYTFTDSTTATVNGQQAKVNCDSINHKLTVTYTFPATDKAKLKSIIVPTAIIGVANGTAKTAPALGLPDKVTIETQDTSVTQADVTWDTDTFASGTYDPNTQTEQTFTLNGMVTLPTDINADGKTLTTQITVTVSAAKYTVTYRGAQMRANSDGTYDIRFLATIDTLDADEVGFVFSKTNSTPTKGNSQIISTTKVYNSIIASGLTVTAVQLGGKYIIACTIENIPSSDVGSYIYVRAFATKGTETTYTEVKTVTIKGLQ